MAFLLYSSPLRHIRWNEIKRKFSCWRDVSRWRFKAGDDSKRWKIVIAIFHAFMRRLRSGPVGSGKEEMTLKCFCWFVSRLIAFNLSVLLNFPLRLITRIFMLEISLGSCAVNLILFLSTTLDF